MSEQSAEAEPTMEEILASIRKIISEDDDDGANAEGEVEVTAPEPEPAPKPEVMAEPEPEPEVMAEPEPEPEVMAEPEPETLVESEEDVLELTEVVEEEGDLIIFDEDDTIAPEPEPAFMEVDPVKPVGDIDEDELLSVASTAASAGTLGALASSMKLADSDGQTIEGVMRELLRPLLKDWLDTNLPPIVEAKVEAAIDKVVRHTRI